jgi:hypothetical protein
MAGRNMMTTRELGAADYDALLGLVRTAPGCGVERRRAEALWRRSRQIAVILGTFDDAGQLYSVRALRRDGAGTVRILAACHRDGIGAGSWLRSVRGMIAWLRAAGAQRVIVHTDSMDGWAAIPVATRPPIQPMTEGFLCAVDDLERFVDALASASLP